MKHWFRHMGIVMLSGMLLLASCQNKDVVPQAAAPDPVGSPVLFTSGNEPLTRAATPYMAQGGRFVCTMYYHPVTGDTDESPFDIAEGGTAATAWLKVNNAVGNSVYRQMDFDEEGMTTDDLDFDKNATIFYWQNRLNHAFLALADYHQLSTNVGANTPVASQGKLKMFPNGEYPEDSSINVYDLTRGEGPGRLTSITQQPDPILALTIMKPAGATQEANRVRLYFQHQFSQIQVNIKDADDASASVSADQITKVELLGVSTEGYVKNQMNTDGTVGTVPENSPAGTVNAAWANDIHLDNFTDDELAQNKWGTSFEMFDMATGVVEEGRDKGYAVGFVKSYNAIAFGELWAIRITWHENTGEPPIEHVTTFEVPLKNENLEELRELKSGMKYIYGLELRRGTLAVIRAEILDWEQDEALLYGANGTITN